MADNNGNLRERLSQHIRCRRSAASIAKTSDKPPWRVNARRFFAFVIDGATLKAFGTALTLLMGEKLLFLGDDGWWFGLLIMCAYFAFFDSYIGKGRTFGKRLAGIEVVGIDGDYLSPFDALLRFSPFAIIYAIGEFSKNADAYSPFVNGLEVLTTFLSIAVIAFAIFHPNRRSIHDLLLDSVVVRVDQNFVIKAEPIKRSLTAFLIAAAIIGGAHAATSIYLVTSPSGKKLSRIWNGLASRADIENPRVRWTFRLGKKEKLEDVLLISAYIPKMKNVVDPVYTKQLAKNILHSISARRDAPENTRRIRIEFRSGYSFGLGGMVLKSSYEFPYSREVVPLKGS